MWTSSQTKRAGAPVGGSAELGVVTAGGKESSVYLGTQRRGLPVAAPGGYRWRPEMGKQVLVLKAGMDGESAWVLAQAEQQGDDLLPGEVELAGPDCSLKLTHAGTVELRGCVSINGTTLDDLIRSMVAQALAQEG